MLRNYLENIPLELVFFMDIWKHYPTTHKEMNIDIAISMKNLLDFNNGEIYDYTGCFINGFDQRYDYNDKLPEYEFNIQFTDMKTR